MSSVLALTQTARRYRFLAAVLAAMDVVVVGYSGWDDFDIVPVIARTRSSHRLTWTMHEDRARLAFRDSRAARAELAAEWEADTVGLDRVLLNLDQDGAPVRAPENVVQVFGPTARVLEQLCADRDCNAPEPAEDVEPYRFGRAFPAETHAFFDTWTATFPASPWRRHAFLRSAFELRLQEPLAAAMNARIEAGARPAITAQSSPADRLLGLLEEFNDMQVTFPPDAPERQALERMAMAIETLRTQLAHHDDVLALRLLGCVRYYIAPATDSDLCFARSATLARQERLTTGELSTLLNWRAFWRSRFGDGNLHGGFASDAAIAFSSEEGGLSLVSDMSMVPAGSERPRPFPSYPEEAIDRRIEELEEETGYLPLVARDELAHPLPDLLEAYADDIDELVDRVRRLRRHAVDVGDVLGEAESTVRLAHVMSAVEATRLAGLPTRTEPTESVTGIGDVKRSGIELIRIEELGRLLPHPIEDPLMGPFAPWRNWVSEPDELQRRIRRSMWGALGEPDPSPPARRRRGRLGWLMRRGAA